MLRNLGLRCEKIDAYKHDCALFCKENEHLERCLVCDESRYKMSGKEVGQKKIPHKMFRYFPLKPQLQRLFMSRYTFVDMRWHYDKRVDDDVLRHPANAEE